MLLKNLNKEVDLNMIRTFLYVPEGTSRFKN